MQDRLGPAKNIHEFYCMYVLLCVCEIELICKCQYKVMLVSRSVHVFTIFITPTLLRVSYKFRFSLSLGSGCICLAEKPEKGLFAKINFIKPISLVLLNTYLLTRITVAPLGDIYTFSHDATVTLATARNRAAPIVHLLVMPRDPPRHWLERLLRLGCKQDRLISFYTHM